MVGEETGLVVRLVALRSRWLAGAGVSGVLVYKGCGSIASSDTVGPDFGAGCQDS